LITLSGSKDALSTRTRSKTRTPLLSKPKLAEDFTPEYTATRARLQSPSALPVPFGCACPARKTRLIYLPRGVT
jgi:hypothetical protein